MPSHDRESFHAVGASASVIMGFGTDPVHSLRPREELRRRGLVALSEVPGHGLDGGPRHRPDLGGIEAGPSPQRGEQGAHRSPVGSGHPSQTKRPRTRSCPQTSRRWAPRHSLGTEAEPSRDALGIHPRSGPSGDAIEGNPGIRPDAGMSAAVLPTSPARRVLLALMTSRFAESRQDERSPPRRMGRQVIYKQPRWPR